MKATSPLKMVKFPDQEKLFCPHILLSDHHFHLTNTKLREGTSLLDRILRFQCAIYVEGGKYQKTFSFSRSLNVNELQVRRDTHCWWRRPLPWWSRRTFPALKLRGFVMIKFFLIEINPFQFILENVKLWRKFCKAKVKQPNNAELTIGAV